MSDERTILKVQLSEEVKQQLSEKLAFPISESGWFEISVDESGKVRRLRHADTKPVIININELPQDVEDLIAFYEIVLKRPLPTDNTRTLNHQELEKYRQNLCSFCRAEFSKTIKQAKNE